MSLFGMPEGVPCCCLGGCCENVVLPECITLELTASCCSSTDTLELCQSTGPPVPQVDSLSPIVKYTGTTSVDWCDSTDEGEQVLSEVNIAIFCAIDELTDERHWYIYINDSATTEHSWFPDGYLYKLILTSCDPLLLSFGGPADCSGQCEWIWELACFAKGTMIHTPSGTVAIETLRKGDSVYDQHGKTVEVVDIHSRIVLNTLVFMDESGNTTEVTPEHPFILSGGDPQSTMAQNLTIETRLPRGKSIISISNKSTPQTVYNLSVSGSRTFVANGFAVHNK